MIKLPFEINRIAIRGAKNGYQRLCHAANIRAIDEKLTIFVTGNQRSGTNMVMDVFEKSWATDVFHETDTRAFVNYQMRDTETISTLVKKSPSKRVVVKALCEAQDTKRLIDIHKPAKAIWVVRDYRDVVNSMMISFRNMAKQAQRIAIDRHSDGWRGDGMSDATHHLVRDIVTPQIDDASASALQWYYRNVLFFEQGLDHDPRVMLVVYEDMVKDPIQSFLEIFRFSALDFSERVCNHIYSSSVKKRQTPTIDPRVSELCEKLKQKFIKIQKQP